MNNFDQNEPVWRSGTGVQLDIDQGLRNFMIRVYQFMAMGLGLTGAVAYFASTSPALMQTIHGTGLMYLVMFAPLVMVMVLSFRIQKMSFSSAQTMFWVYSALMGLSLSSIFLVFTGASIAQTFFVTASVFLGMSLYGYTTKKDLTSMGSFLMMGLFGIVLASIVNIFLGNSTLDLMISVLGVLIFTGLTAYDTQKIKEIYNQNTAVEVQNKQALMGALSLYLDFVNLFLMLLRLFGDRR